jgi:cytochrome c2
MLILVLALVACDNNTKAEFGLDALPEEVSVERGERIFKNGTNKAPECTACHTLSNENGPNGPGMGGFARRADERVDGQSAREYTLNSIIAPGMYLVPGYSNQMFGDYGDKLSKQEIADVMAFLLSLE